MDEIDDLITGVNAVCEVAGLVRRQLINNGFSVSAAESAAVNFVVQILTPNKGRCE